MKKEEFLNFACSEDKLSLIVEETVRGYIIAPGDLKSTFLHCSDFKEVMEEIADFFGYKVREIVLSRTGE